MRWSRLDNRRRDSSRSEAAANAILVAHRHSPALKNERPALTLRKSTVGSKHDPATWQLLDKEATL